MPACLMLSPLQEMRIGKQRDGQMPVQLLRNGRRKPNLLHLISLNRLAGVAIADHHDLQGKHFLGKQIGASSTSLKLELEKSG